MTQYLAKLFHIYTSYEILEGHVEVLGELSLA